MDIQCFMVEPTNQCFRALRRFSTGSGCPGRYGYHNAITPIETGEVVIDADFTLRTEPDEWPRDDPRWPTRCECGYEFTPQDAWQLWYDQIWRDPATGSEYPHRDLPPGAMWYSPWHAKHLGYVGPDGKCLCVMTPGGEWNIDGRASNCTLPDDNVHKCWLRHGEPPNVTVDKSGGFTCSAGAGSIQAGPYHGFLRGGSLVSC